eukprot:g73775.t1
MAPGHCQQKKKGSGPDIFPQNNSNEFLMFEREERYDQKILVELEGKNFNQVFSGCVWLLVCFVEPLWKGKILRFDIIVLIL